MLEAEPDAIAHQATALADVNSPRTSTAASSERTGCGRRAPTRLWLRREEAGAGRFVVSSFAPTRHARGRPVKTEDDPVDPAPLEGMRETMAALDYLEQTVTEAGESRFATAASTEPITTRWLSPSASGSSRSLVTAVGSPRSFTSMMPPPRRCSRARARGTGDLQHRGRRARPGTGGCRSSQPCWVEAALQLPCLAREGVCGRRRSHGEPRPVALRTSSAARAGWTPSYPSWRQGFADVYATSTQPDAEPALSTRAG